jgi:hypothetical protein
MGIFGRFLGSPEKSGVGHVPTRVLQFLDEPPLENGTNFAERFRTTVSENENIHLDFSVESLKFVDVFLQRCRDEGLSVNNFSETIFAAGCYVGQVMVENNGGVWVKQSGAKMPIAIKLPNRTITDPITKSFKRFCYGESDSILFYYRVLTTDYNQPSVNQTITQGV